MAIIVGLWSASIALELGLCIRLTATGLWRVYPRFFAYMAALAAESCILLAAGETKGLYWKVWVPTRAVLLCLEILAVLEIFSRWSDSYPGIGKFGKRLLLVLLLLSTGLCLSTLPINWSATGWVIAIYVTSVANRAVQSGLTAFLALMIGFFVKFGGPVAPNLWRHTWAMTVFLAANALGYFLITSRAYQIGNTCLQAISSGALVYWIFAMRSSGEQIPRMAADPEAWHEAEIMNRQLMDFADSIKKSRKAVGKS